MVTFQSQVCFIVWSETYASSRTSILFCGRVTLVGTEQLVNPRRMHMAVNHCYTFQLQVPWQRDWVASAVDTETKSRAHKARITRLLIFDFSDKSRMLGEQRKHKSSFSPPQNHQYETPTSYLAVGVRTIRRQSMQGPSTSFPGCILGCPVAPPV